MAKKKAKIATIQGRYGSYSDEVISKFEALDIQLGDKVRIDQADSTVDGNLIAQNDLGNPNTVLIKLPNGYNIGVSITDVQKLTKLEGSVELESFRVRAPKQDSELPKISLIATGGTIASRIDYQTGGVVMAMQPEEIFASLPELFNEISFKSIKSLFSMGSEDLGSKQWEKIASEAYQELNDSSRGIVISHGTDTMAYTSAILSFMLPNVNAPVVLTGAQRSSDRGSFDGAINLISACRVAAKADLASVMVCMHETSDDDSCLLIRGTRARKMHTSRRDAFRPINDEAFGRITAAGKIIENGHSYPRRHDKSLELKNDFDDRVALIKVYPGIDPEILDWYIDRGTKGIILEGTGLGHVPTFPPENEKRSWSTSVERAVEDGIYVGMTSQCLYGSVHPFVYRALRIMYQLGVNYLDDMIPETSLLKLGWALAQTQTYDELQKLMLHNVAGEINTQNKFVEFLN